MDNSDKTWNDKGDETYDFGEHTNKDLKGSIPSDDSLKEDIKSRLTDDAFIDASDISVVVEHRKVILMGTVPDKSSMRRAEDISELVSGVSNVENRLRVK